MLNEFNDRKTVTRVDYGKASEVRVQQMTPAKKGRRLLLCEIRSNAQADISNRRIINMQGGMTSDSVKTGVAPQTEARSHRHTSALFDHEHRPYRPRNVNLLHKAEQKAAGANTRIAVGLTKRVGTMWTAYAFAALAVVGLMAIVGVLSPVVALLVVWISQTFLQLTLLPIIMVGQNVLGRKSELQADEQFNTTMTSFNDIEQIMLHLTAQDEELLRHTHMLIHLLEKNGISPQQVEAEVTSGSHLAGGPTQSQSSTDVPPTRSPAESEKHNT
ncbi:MAG: hypothetical protein ACXV5E_08125 [Halobacteriota archaeon]